MRCVFALDCPRNLDGVGRIAKGLLYNAVITQTYHKVPRIKYVITYGS